MDVTVGVHQTGFSGSDALDLRSGQHDACRIAVNDQVVELGPLVLYVDVSGVFLQFVLSCHSFQVGIKKPFKS